MCQLRGQPKHLRDDVAGMSGAINEVKICNNTGDEHTPR